MEVYNKTKKPVEKPEKKEKKPAPKS